MIIRVPPEAAGVRSMQTLAERGENKRRMAIDKIFADFPGRALLRPAGEAFAAAGFDFVLSGGAVRDAMLGRHCDDFDVVTDAAPARISELLAVLGEEVHEVPNGLGTRGVRVGRQGIEVTTYRSPDFDKSGPRGGAVHSPSSLEKDLLCRDFTVNAIAWRVPQAEPADPLGGATDLRHRVLRTPRDPLRTFRDDPSRLIRAARFAASLDFSLAPDTAAAMSALADELRTAPEDGVSYELAKLLALPEFERAVAILVQTGLADALAGRLRDAPDGAGAPLLGEFHKRTRTVAPMAQGDHLLKSDQFQEQYAACHYREFPFRHPALGGPPRGSTSTDGRAAACQL